MSCWSESWSFLRSDEMIYLVPGRSDAAGLHHGHEAVTQALAQQASVVNTHRRLLKAVILGINNHMWYVTYMDWLFLTDEAINAALRARCRRERLEQNMTQSTLAERAGLGINTIRRYESDHDYSPSLDTFIRIIRVLGALEVLDQVLPERPLDPLNPDASERLRARPTTTNTVDGEWTWGTEQ